MSKAPIARRFRCPSILIFLVLLGLAWAGGSSATAAEPATSPAPALQSFLCTLQTGSAAELPGQVSGPQLKGGLGMCSPQCGYASCRGVLVGSTCTKLNGSPGTCYGPSLGKKCADGLPMCVCA
jgi:hypothetical protein